MKGSQMVASLSSAASWFHVQTADTRATVLHGISQVCPSRFKVSNWLNLSLSLLPHESLRWQGITGLTQ